jgi:hypothetical protein
MVAEFKFNGWFGVVLCSQIVYFVKIFPFVLLLGQGFYLFSTENFSFRFPCKAQRNLVLD